MAATVNNISGVRLLESGAASTSGRQAPSSQPASPLARDLVSLLYQQNLEIDALVRLESERLRAGMGETCERRCRALVSGLEQQVMKRLMEKEAELESVNRRNAELEQQMRQVSEENKIWFAMAKNNEAVVCSLRTSLSRPFSGAPPARGRRAGRVRRQRSGEAACRRRAVVLLRGGREGPAADGLQSVREEGRVRLAAPLQASLPLQGLRIEGARVSHLWLLQGGLPPNLHVLSAREAFRFGFRMVYSPCSVGRSDRWTPRPVRSWNLFVSLFLLVILFCFCLYFVELWPSFWIVM
ncbi:unnamed protein product [Musa acuminata var. zebrina]